MLLTEVNLKLRREFKDPRLSQITVTKVILNEDYSVAKIFWDTFDPSLKKEASLAIKNIAGAMRTKLAETIKVRHMPALEFIYDSQYEDEKKITDLLKDS